MACQQQQQGSINQTTCAFLLINTLSLENYVFLFFIISCILLSWHHHCWHYFCLLVIQKRAKTRELDKIQDQGTPDSAVFYSFFQGWGTGGMSSMPPYAAIWCSSTYGYIVVFCHPNFPSGRMQMGVVSHLLGLAR